MQKSYESLFRISLLYQGFGVIRLIQYQKIDSKICMLICSWERYFLNACQLILVIFIMHKIMLHMNKKGDSYHSRFCMASSAVLNLPVDLNLTLNFSYQITSNIDVYHLQVKNRRLILAKFCKMIATEFMQRNVLLKT